MSTFNTTLASTANQIKGTNTELKVETRTGNEIQGEVKDISGDLLVLNEHGERLGERWDTFIKIDDIVSFRTV